METPSLNGQPPLPFEEALQNLEEVVRALEKGDGTLEESLAKYETGIGLLRHCYEVLRVAEQTVKEMSEENELGKPIPKPFPMPARGEDSSEARRRPRPTDSAY